MKNYFKKSHAHKPSKGKGSYDRTGLPQDIVDLIDILEEGGYTIAGTSYNGIHSGSPEFISLMDNYNE